MRASTWSTRVSCPCGTPPPFTLWSRRLCSHSRSSRSHSRTSTGRGSLARPTFRTMVSTARPTSAVRNGAGAPPPTRRVSSRPKRSRATPTPRARTRPLRDACFPTCPPCAATPPSTALAISTTPTSLALPPRADWPSSGWRATTTLWPRPLTRARSTMPSSTWACSSSRSGRPLSTWPLRWRGRF